MRRLIEKVRNYERDKLLEGVAEDQRAALREAYDLLDSLDGLYVGGFLALVSGYVFDAIMLFFQLSCHVAIVYASLHPEVFSRPLEGFAFCAGYPVFSLYLWLRYVRAHNRQKLTLRGIYEKRMRAEGVEPDERLLSRVYRTFAEWPVWCYHAALLAFACYGTAGYLHVL